MTLESARGAPTDRSDRATYVCGRSRKRAPDAKCCHLSPVSSGGRVLFEYIKVSALHPARGNHKKADVFESEIEHAVAPGTETRMFRPSAGDPKNPAIESGARCSEQLYLGSD